MQNPKFDTAYTIANFKEQQDQFNIISGAVNKLTLADIINQDKIMQSEFQEQHDAIAARDATELIDGCIDSLFTTLGMLQKLEGLNVNVNAAMKQVAMDNLDKFPKTEQEARDTVTFYANKNIECYYLYMKEFDCYVVKDMNGKVRKPYNFKPTDLSKYVTPELLAALEVKDSQ